MFDIGWAELLVLAAVTIIVVGPKELPGLLRSVGQIVRKVKSLSSDFRSQFDEAIQTEEIKKLRADLHDANPVNKVRETIDDHLDTDPFGFDDDIEKLRDGADPLAAGLEDPSLNPPDQNGSADTQVSDVQQVETDSSSELTQVAENHSISDGEAVRKESGA